MATYYNRISALLGSFATAGGSTYYSNEDILSNIVTYTATHSADINEFSLSGFYEYISRTGSEGAVGFQHGDNWTFAGWIKPSLNIVEGRIWSLGATVGPRVNIATNGKLVWGTTGAAWIRLKQTDIAINPGVWSFIELNVIGSNLATWTAKINGVSVSSSTSSSVGTVSTNTYTGFVERFGTQTTTANPYVGFLSTCVIFNTNPSSTVIDHIYNLDLDPSTLSGVVAGVDWLGADLTSGTGVVYDIAGGGNYTPSNTTASELSTALPPGYSYDNWINLRNYFNTRNSSATQPGTADTTGSVTLNSLTDSSTSWPALITTAGDTSGHTNAMTWHDPVSSVFGADTPDDWKCVVEGIVYLSSGLTASNFHTAVATGVIGTNDKANLIGFAYPSGFASAMVGSNTNSIVSVSGTQSHNRVINIPMPGTATNSLGFSIAMSRNTGNVAVSNSVAIGRSVASAYADVTGSVHRVGASIGSRNVLTNQGGNFIVVVRGSKTDYIKADGGTDWYDIAFPGGSPTTDTGGLYVSDGGAHATDWNVTFNGNSANGNSGHTPAAGTGRIKYTVTTPTGLIVDGSRPIEIVIEVLSGTSTAGSIAFGAGVIFSGNTEGYVVGINQVSSTLRRVITWAKTSTSAGGSSASILHSRGAIVENYGTSITNYHGGVCAMGHTNNGPENSVAGCESNAGSTTTLSGTPQIQIVIHNLTSTASNITANFRVQMRNVDLNLRQLSLA